MRAGRLLAGDGLAARIDALPMHAGHCGGAARTDVARERQRAAAVGGRSAADRAGNTLALFGIPVSAQYAFDVVDASSIGDAATAQL
jgi:hypothetical protein